MFFVQVFFGGFFGREGGGGCCVFGDFFFNVGLFSFVVLLFVFFLIFIDKIETLQI